MRGWFHFQKYSPFLFLLWPLFAPSISQAAWDEHQVYEVGSPLNGVNALDFITSTEGWALLNASPIRVLHTQNGGMEWMEIASLPQFSFSPFIPSQRFQMLNANEGWLIPTEFFHGKSLLHSTDGGETWPEAPHPFQGPFGKICALCFLDSQVGWIAGVDDSLAGMIAATTDGGTTWRVQATPVQFEANDLFFFDEIHGCAVGPWGLSLYTHNGGTTWKYAQVDTFDSLFRVRFADALHGWAVGAGGTILYTLDGGARWHPQKSRTVADLFDIVVISLEEAIVCGADGASGVVLITSNGGTSWRKENLPTDVPLRTVARVGNDIWVGGGAPNTGAPYEARVFHREYQTGDYPTILVEEFPGGTVGIPYEFAITARNGTGPYIWTILSGAPSGLELNPNSGLLAGIPDSATQSLLSIQVQDSNQNIDQVELPLKIISEPLTFTQENSGILPSAVHRKTYRFPLNVSGGHQPYQWRFLGENPPPGLAVDHQSVLVGTPLETGAFDFEIEVTDNGSLPQRATATFHLDVEDLSEDGWEIQHANNRITDIHFFDENLGVAIGWSGLQYDTRDGGKTWSHKPLGAAAWDFDWIGDDGWMLSNAGIGHSSDRGRNWEFQELPLPNAEGIKFRDALHGWAHGNGIAYTEDGGSTWHSAETPAGYYFALGFADAQNGFAGGNNFVFVKSTDAGRTWTPATLPPYVASGLKERMQKQPTPWSPEKAEKVPQIREIYFVDSQVGWIGTNIIEDFSPLLYRTGNGGMEWEKRHVGGKGTIDFMQFLPDGIHGWMGGLFSGTFYRTVDAGANWEDITFGSSTHILGFHFLNEDVGWVLPNVVGDIDETNTIQDLEGAIWRTADGGRNFHLQYGWVKDRPDVGEDYLGQDSSPGPQFLDLSFVDAEHGWALARTTFGQSAHVARIFFTDSGGADWKVRGTLDLGVHRMCFANTLRGFALHTSNDEPVFETRDGGFTWSPRQDILQLIRPGGLTFDSNWGDVAFADDQYGWIVFNGDYVNHKGTRKLLRTTDGGNTWERINDTEERGGLFKLFFLDREHGWMVNNYGFIESTTDGGENWTVQRTNYDGIVDLKAVHFTNEFSGWAVGAAGAVLSTTDGGAHWRPEVGDATTEFTDVYFASCLKGWFGGEANPSYTMGDPVLIETESGDFQGGYPIDQQIKRHNVRVVESPDTVNVWALGDFGLGLKYAAPSSALFVTTRSLPEGRVGQSYSAQLESMNGLPALNWRICGGALPMGLSVSSDGLISGIPTAAATFRFVAAVFDSAGESAGRKLTIRVEPESSPIILTETLPDGNEQVDYEVILEVTGTTGPFEWHRVDGALPPGLDLLAYGVIGGIPEIPGNYEFEVEVLDGQSPSGSARKEWSIEIKGPVITPESGPCDEFPLFCLALNWMKPPPVTQGDFDNDGDADAFDALEALSRSR